MKRKLSNKKINQLIVEINKLNELYQNSKEEIQQNKYLNEIIKYSSLLINANTNIKIYKEGRSSARLYLAINHFNKINYNTEDEKKLVEISITPLLSDSNHNIKELLLLCLEDCNWLIKYRHNIIFNEYKKVQALDLLFLITKEEKYFFNALESLKYLIKIKPEVFSHRELRARLLFNFFSCSKNIKYLEESIDDTTFLIDENYNIEKNKENRSKGLYYLSTFINNKVKKRIYLNRALEDLKDNTSKYNIFFKASILLALTNITNNVKIQIEYLTETIDICTKVIPYNLTLRSNEAKLVRAHSYCNLSNLIKKEQIQLLEKAFFDVLDLVKDKFDLLEVLNLLLKIIFGLYLLTQNNIYIKELLDILNNIIKENPLNKQATIMKVSLLIDMSNDKLPNVFQGDIKEEIEQTFKDFLIIFNTEFNEVETLDKKQEFIDEYANVIINYLSYLNEKANAEYDNQSEVFKTIWELIESSKSLLEKVLLQTAASNKNKQNTINNTHKVEELSNKLSQTKIELSNKARGNTRSLRDVEENSKDTLRKISEIESTIVEVNLNNSNYSKELKFYDLKKLMLKQKTNTALCYVYSSKDENKDIKFFRNNGMFIVYKNDKEELEFYIEELKNFEASSLNLYLILYKLFNVYTKSSDLKSSNLDKEEIKKTKEYLLNEINEINEIFKDRKTKILEAFERTFLEDKEFTCIKELFTWANNKEPLEVEINLEKLDSLEGKDYDKFLELRIKMTEFVLEEVSSSILPIINRNIKDVKNIIFSALGNFSQFPLHALKQNSSFLIENKNISYIPSLSVLHLRQDRQQKETTDSRLIYEDINDTASFIAEKKAIEDISEDIEALGSSNFTSSSFLEYLESSNNNILHLALHGKARNSIYSSIVLNKNSEIYASDILCSSINSKIVLLATCETNLDSKGSSTLVSVSSFPTVFMIQSTDHILGSFLAIDGDEISKFTPRLYSKLYSNGFDFSLAFQSNVSELLEGYEKSNNKGLLSKLFKKDTTSTMEVDFISSREWFFYAPFSSNY